ncbi:MAG: virulence protein RhuM/Fic/DOC family protein [Ignavibacteriales bacterium]|nr:virulence protein RhuM/Fic/DOC family protein [Ignavibacteriales bacterium]
MKQPPQKGEIIIYRTEDGATHIDVRLEQEMVWLTQKQMATLFKTERSVITKHIRNIFRDKELRENSVCAIFAHTASDGKEYRTTFYNLDMAISVGYRVNSKRGTQFRIWATSVLREHLVRGYTVNERRLKELRQAVQLIAEVAERHPLTSDEATAVLRVVRDYTFALDLLDDYDHQRVSLAKTTKVRAAPVTYEEARRIIERVKEKFAAPALFGQEKDESLHGSLQAVFQTFSGKDLYPGLEEKAAHLLYFLVKNHSFVDGNKRIAAALFLWFLEKNRVLYKADGSKRLGDNALVAMTLLIAESKPAEKEILARVVANLLTKQSA